MLSRVFLITAAISLIISCNNPFSTRAPEEPDEITGAAIKPANSPENVIFNLRASFESFSIQDYKDVFSEDFTFNPDPDDSLLYEVVFRNGWGIEAEEIYVENYLQKANFSEIEFLTHSYEYRAGEDMFDYKYSILVFGAVDSTSAVSAPLSKQQIKGHAWLYLREDEEGRWRIYKWVEIANMIEDAFITWGVLRALNAGF